MYERDSKPMQGCGGSLRRAHKRLQERCGTQPKIETELSITFGALKRLDAEGIPSLVKWIVSAMWCCKCVDI